MKLRSLSINQPYFFPYLGYFQLVAATDYFVCLDSVQYTKRRWINRNRILKPNGTEWQYVTIPIEKPPKDAIIRDVKIFDSNWKTKLLGQLQHYKNKTRHFKEAFSIIQKSIDNDTKSLAEINFHIISQLFNSLEIEFTGKMYSQMNIEHDEPQLSDDWAVYISKALNAGKYVNLPGGKSIFDCKRFSELGIELEYIVSQLPRYNTGNRATYISGLSIIDVLMFNGIKETKRMVESYKTERAANIVSSITDLNSSYASS